jgi:maltose alpha-D-glucosyltransferase/alpha-amylase
VSERVQEAAEEIVRNESIIIGRFARLIRRKISAMKIVVHGAMSLGKFLNTGKDFVIAGLEGDVSRALSERSLKRSPLSDVATMMRSFDAAARAAMARQPLADIDYLEPWVKIWVNQVSEEFVAAYVEAALANQFIPANEEDRQLLLDVLVADCLSWEIDNALAFHPHRADAPIRALRDLIRHFAVPAPESVVKPPQPAAAGSAA